MKQGVLVIAIGNANYGNYAHQLCMSIKATCPGTSVTCAYAEGALNHVLTNPLPNNFDSLIHIPSHCYMTNGLKDYVKAKTYAYDLSPYEQTILVDADVIWTPHKPVSDLFELLKNELFTCANRGRQQLSEAPGGFVHWCDPKDMETAGYKGWLYNLSSEFMYFRKDKNVAKLFKHAQDFFNNPPSFNYKRFSFGLPDELAFEAACMKTEIYPHAYPFLPFYWEHFEKKHLPVYDIYKQFYAISLGGNLNDKTSAQAYDSLAGHYNKQFGINGYFPARDKKSWLPERTII
jgi:hypothetical protein